MEPTMDTSLAATTVEDSILRQLEPQWSKGVIAASIAISLLGAFTSTQLFVTVHHNYL